MKCKGAKKAMWQSDRPVQEGRAPAPAPVYPTPVKEEMEEGCYYGPPAYAAAAEEPYGPVYGLVQQGRPRGGHSSPNMRDWGRPAPAAPMWGQSPLEMRNQGSGQINFMYPGPAEQQLYMSCPKSYSSTPDTPDSGFWDVALENSPPLVGQYSKMEDSWRGSGREARLQPPVQHAPLPELSLQEILGELEEDWLGGEEPGPGPEDKTFC